MHHFRDPCALETRLNQWGKKRCPFFFIIDFDINHYYCAPFDHLEHDIFFSIDGFSHPRSSIITKKGFNPLFQKRAISFTCYQKAFNRVMAEIREGNTYLLNLTFPTELVLQASLLEIFIFSQAKFKLYFKDHFVTFSPERFIQIQENIIKTYPMKGTLDASLAGARETLLMDEKEKAEHTLVVDLLRNDLSRVAQHVTVNRFRYIDQIQAGTKELLQVSSEISGFLEERWAERIGSILLTLLPAGSISGAPKKKTLEIIKAVEGYDRGFFTGIFGYFDGHQLDSAVMIRFIEKQGDRIVYKSGGGITIDSCPKREYQEMLDKVYIPCF